MAAVTTVVCAFGVSLILSLALCCGLGQLHAYGAHTRAQITIGIVFAHIVAAWIAAEVSSRLGPGIQVAVYEATRTAEADIPPEVVGAAADTKEVPVTNGTNGASADPRFEAKLNAALSSNLAAFRAAAEMVAVMALLYLCDRTNVIHRAEKVYNPTQFWAVCGIILVAALLSLRKITDTKPLSREQTDEWKGWMQIMFLLYHYFEEKEVYNAIRIYIAAYVWMTGYGNFFLYRRGKSFTTRRTLQMLFRLNLLGCLVCVVLNNEYMLYYICAMHTLFTVFVLLAMYILNRLNSSTKVLYAKVALTLLCTLLLYDGPDQVFRAVFGTIPGVRQLFAFHDPLHPEFKDEMHEFHFRSGLDRFIWIIGMIYALHFPNFEEGLAKISSMDLVKRVPLQLAMLAVSLVIGFVWWHQVFVLDKYAYNKVHPYTSAIPLTIYLLLRNFTETLRTRYLYLFAYMGKVTLETYIFQFHIWMKTTGLNGSPKSLLEVIPGFYWANFVVISAAYIFISIRFSNLTGVLRDALIPESLLDTTKIWGGLALGVAYCWVLSWLYTMAHDGDGA